MKISISKKRLGLISFVLFALSVTYITYTLYRVSYSVKKDNYTAITIINNGRLEIEEVFVKTGKYKIPLSTVQQINAIGYHAKFELTDNNSYTLGTDLISFNPFYDPHYCINKEGKQSVFDHFECNL